MAIYASVFLVALVTIGSTMASQELQDSFNWFINKFDKKYTAEEHEYRFEVYQANMERVNEMNKEHILAGGDAVFGVTKFMDLTPEEFKSMYLTYQPSLKNQSTSGLPVKSYSAEAIANTEDKIDWREKDAVTDVRDQGRCGSCWAFSAVEAIESYGFLYGGYKLQKLSVQQVVDCDTVDLGCQGGNTETAYDYITDAPGLIPEWRYSYTGVDGRCGFKKDWATTFITGFQSVDKGEDNLKAALNEGPVSICLAAQAFQYYEGGVLKRCFGLIDHCVQGVGYATVAGDSFWIIRNSWGTSWGEAGFIRIEQGHNACQVSNDVTYPVFK